MSVTMTDGKKKFCNVAMVKNTVKPKHTKPSKPLTHFI